jgi:cytochrome c-type biogenesis protein
MSEVQPNLVTLVFAAGAGLLSFVSPCVLPLLPAYLSYITGLSADQLIARQDVATRARVLGHSLAFVLGLSCVFTLLGASATLVGRSFLQNIELITKLAGLFVVVFGLHMLGLLHIPLFYQEKRVELVAQQRRGLLGALLMGAAFAAGWTPCVGPFLASLLGLASQEETLGQGMLLLFVYGLGLGVPFVLAGLAMERSLRVMRALRPRLRAVELFSGVLLVAMGVLLFTDRVSLVSSWLTRVFGIGLAL